MLSEGDDVTEGVYSARVEAVVSEVSRLPEVRAQLLGEQRRVIGKAPWLPWGATLGTVCLGRAELKVYLDAPLETRALRKWSSGGRTGRISTLRACEIYWKRGTGSTVRVPTRRWRQPPTRCGLIPRTAARRRS